MKISPSQKRNLWGIALVVFGIIGSVVLATEDDKSREIIAYMGICVAFAITGLILIVAKKLKIGGIIAIAFGLLFIPVIWLEIIPEFRTTPKFEHIINDSKKLVKECIKLGDISVQIKGKCLVWDEQFDRLDSDVSNSLPLALVAKPDDSPVTVFMILPIRYIKEAQYTVSGQPAYRAYADICVIYWPEKVAVGMHTVMGGLPEKTRVPRKEPGYGSASAAIANWIIGLKKPDNQP